MTFVALDDKEWCKGIYTNGSLHFNELPESLDRTWKYLPYLNDKNVEYAHLYCEGKELNDLCPESLKIEWSFYNKKLLAFLNSFKEGKINLNDNCVYDLLPAQFLLEYCEIKTQIIDSIFEQYSKPKNYEFSLELEKVLDGIKKEKLNIDTSGLLGKRHEIKVRDFLKNLATWSPHIDYNQFGTKTGRLTTKKHTFPILNLNSEFRSIIKPTNDFFLELDFNAAELRVLLALADEKQPNGDVHAFNAQRLNMTRADAKKEAFAWLYGSSKVDAEKFNKIYSTDKVIEKYYDGKKVTNYFGREIESDRFHSLNYIVQSTTSDMVLRQLIKIAAYLKDKKSKVGFIIHDSVVLDISSTESGICTELSNLLRSCEFGIFPIRIRIGKDFGTLKEVKT